MFRTLKRLQLVLALRWTDGQVDDIEFSQRCLDNERARLQKQRAALKSDLLRLDLVPLDPPF